MKVVLVHDKLVNTLKVRSWKEFLRCKGDPLYRDITPVVVFPEGRISVGHLKDIVRRNHLIYFHFSSDLDEMQRRIGHIHGEKMLYCDDCDEFVPKSECCWQDYGIGAYEFHGAQCTDVNLQYVHEWCECSVSESYRGPQYEDTESC